MMSAHAEVPPEGLVAGLAIDDRLLRVVVIDRRAAPKVIDAAEADLPAEVVAQGRVLDNAALGSRIGALWRTLGLGGVPTFVGFHPSDAALHTVSVTGWPRSGWPAEVLTAVATIRSAFGADPVWSATPVTEGDAVSARVVACRRADVSNAVWAARRSGVWVAGVEVSALAVERAIQPIAHRFALVLDRSGASLATAMLLERGHIVRAERLELAAQAEAPTLEVFPLEESVAQDLLRSGGTGTRSAPHLWLSSIRPGSGEAALMVGPGGVLADTSPVPLAGFAQALGLALGAAGVGARPVELQSSLLHTGVALMQSRLGSVLEGAAPPPAAEPVVSFEESLERVVREADSRRTEEPARQARAAAVATVSPTSEGAGPHGSPDVPVGLDSRRARRRRTRIVAVVAGAAALGAFLFARSFDNDPQTGPRQGDDRNSADERITGTSVDRVNALGGFLRP